MGLEKRKKMDKDIRPSYEFLNVVTESWQRATGQIREINFSTGCKRKKLHEEQSTADGGRDHFCYEFWKTSEK